MIEELKTDANERMEKTVEALTATLGRLRTGRAHPGILDGVMVDYYGNSTPLRQVANVTAADARMLTVAPWEKQMVRDIERAIINAGLGLNPVTAGEVIRVPMPALTEETRKGLIRQAKAEAEHTRVSVRNIRRDVLADIRELEKAKEIGEDDERRAQDDIQRITDRHIARVDLLLAEKEKDLMEI
ncbi:MAG: ribosome recycling factor [Porticoccaceae bacterium]|nr:MAG: ribosome recycling factor [Porticoccaceae bacterium]